MYHIIINFNYLGSPYGHCKRNSWSDTEKKKMLEYFDSNFKTGKSPTLQDCQGAKVKCPELSNRSIMQLKLFVHNRLKKNSKTLCH